MENTIPNSVIAAASSVLSAHHYNHTTLNSLFMEAGAPGDAPEGNCETKCTQWLKKCNSDPDTDAFSVLGEFIQSYMDDNQEEEIEGIFGGSSITPNPCKDGQDRINKALAKNQLEYKRGGLIMLLGATPTTKTLQEYIKLGDFASIEIDFNRALDNINTDMYASVTAASSIIEAVCKAYIETHSLVLPNKQSIVPLWKTVQQHMGLNIDPNLSQDQKKILQGLSSIVDGVGAFRTHIGSAHGRGMTPPNLLVSEARLAINSSHTLVIFIMERWHSKEI